MRLNNIFENYGPDRFYYRIMVVNRDVNEFFKDDLKHILEVLSGLKKGDHGSITTYLDVGQDRTKGAADWMANHPAEYFTFGFEVGKSTAIITFDQDSYDMVEDPSEAMKKYQKMGDDLVAKGQDGSGWYNWIEHFKKKLDEEIPRPQGLSALGEWVGGKGGKKQIRLNPNNDISDYLKRKVQSVTIKLGKKPK